MMCVGCMTAANAQSSFTERLQKSKPGEGRVIVHESWAIDDLVNGKTAEESSDPGTTTTTSQRQTEKKGNVTNQNKKAENSTDITNQSTIIVPDTLDQRKMIKNGHKITGYRVQVFSGGNSRNDRLKAEKAGSEIKSLFPGEPVYVHFYSPRWICRMGNYRTYEEAHEVLSRVKRMGYESAIIVKGKITVQYP
jgi:hypothetical protein